MTRILVSDAAKQMGISPQAIRVQMQKKKLPIGVCLKNGSRYTYLIYQEWLDKFLSGEAMEVYLQEQIKNFREEARAKELRFFI